MAVSPQTFTLSATARRQALLGLASCGLILIGMLVAGVAYRGHAGEAYTPLNHFISELGEIGGSRLAWAFNLGIVLGGLGLGAFLVALSRRLTGRFRVAFLAASLAAGASGILVGVFPMDYLATHRIVSGVFFLTSWIVTAVFSAWLLSSPRPGTPRWLVVPGVAAVVVSLAFVAVYSTYHPVDPDGPILDRPEGLWSVPFLEWASLLFLLAWFVCVSIALLREAPGNGRAGDVRRLLPNCRVWSPT
jgi:hypothetical membrane protein